MTNTITTRPATPADRGFVWQLNVLCYQDVVCRQFGQWDADWQEANFEKKWSSQESSLILLAGKPVGILSSAEQDGATFLNEILVHPEYQNQGVGTVILRRLMSESIGSISLQVLKENRALTLYQRLGFQLCNTTETHNILEWKEG